jgi:hypothetical protein
MNTAQKLRAKSGPVRVLSPADIARDYPLEASAEQLSALRDATDADIAAAAKLQRVVDGAAPTINSWTIAVHSAAVSVLNERIVSGSAALALAWVR